MVSRALKPARSHGSDSQLLPVVTFPLFHPHHMSLFWNEETEWKYVPFAPVKPCTFRCSLKGPSMPWNSRKRYSYLFFFGPLCLHAYAYFHCSLHHGCSRLTFILINVWTLVYWQGGCIPHSELFVSSLHVWCVTTSHDVTALTKECVVCRLIALWVAVTSYLCLFVSPYGKRACK